VRRSAAIAIRVPLLSDCTLRQSLAPVMVTEGAVDAGPDSLEPAVGATCSGHSFLALVSLLLKCARDALKLPATMWA
jgi:hypothetical protein